MRLMLCQCCEQPAKLIGYQFTEDQARDTIATCLRQGLTVEDLLEGDIAEAMNDVAPGISDWIRQNLDSL
jgi:hypothetical protein